MKHLIIAIGIASGVAGCAPDVATPEASPTQEAPAAVAQATAHDPHAHGHGHEAPPVPAADGVWATDAALREAMDRLRQEVAARSSAYAAGELGSADAEALATAVERDVRFMIENCQLEPEPDAALHHLIARLMGASDALRADPASTAGLPQLEAVLQDYGRTFDHPGWPSSS
jgi:hypothetical protein